MGLGTTSLGGYSASEVGQFLSISRANAGRGAELGQKVLDKHEDLKDIGNESNKRTSVPHYQRPPLLFV